MFGSKFVLTAIQSNFGQFKVGDRIHRTDKVTLHKTEKGWLLAELGNGNKQPDDEWVIRLFIS
jgi:hypothetical protein